MEKEFIKQWEENKHKLENYFRTTNQSEYNQYKEIVTKIFELCITKASKYVGFNIKNMTVINDGNNQGTEIYIIPFDNYQPDINGYVYTHTYYGSCSGCDTLMNISDSCYGLPSEEQIKEYMILSLHLVQKLKFLNKEEE